jgi:hypothetical protein
VRACPLVFTADLGVRLRLSGAGAAARQRCRAAEAQSPATPLRTPTVTR